MGRRTYDIFASFRSRLGPHAGNPIAFGGDAKAAFTLAYSASALGGALIAHCVRAGEVRTQGGGGE